MEPPAVGTCRVDGSGGGAGSGAFPDRRGSYCADAKSSPGDRFFLRRRSSSDDGESKCTWRANRTGSGRHVPGERPGFAAISCRGKLLVGSIENRPRSTLPAGEKSRAQSRCAVQAKVTDRENFLARRSDAPFARIVPGIPLDSTSGNSELWSIRVRYGGSPSARLALAAPLASPSPATRGAPTLWRTRRS